MKILVIQLKRLGDVLLTTPAMALLKRQLPEAQIDFAVYKEYAGILKNNPHISRVLVYPKDFIGVLRFFNQVRRERYDWVIDFLASGASSWLSFISGTQKRLAFENPHPRFIHNVQIKPPEKILYAAITKLKLLEPLIGPSSSYEKDFLRPELYVRQAKLEAWRHVFENSGHLSAGKILIALSPTSRRATRRWPLERYAQLAKKIIEKWGSQANLVCLWGPGERNVAEELLELTQSSQCVIAPQLRHIHDLAAFLSHCQCLVTNCNGTKHVAVAMGVPAVTIYMSSDPAAWNPPENPLYPIVRAENLECIGCRKNICPLHLECADEVSSQAVFEVVEKLINAKTLAAA